MPNNSGMEKPDKSEEEKAKQRARAAKYRAAHPERIAEYARSYRQRNPEAAAAAQERYKQKHPEKRAEISKRYRERHLEEERARKREYMRKRQATIESFYYYLRYYYGEGADKHYAEQLAKQNGACAVCLAPFGKERLHLDHNHGTNQFRGLLCGSCNRALGLCKENVDIIRKMAAYIEAWGIVPEV